jgi:hypothetical protein
MRLRWIIWGWPLCILLFTLAVTLSTFLFPDIGARPVVIMTFLFVIPGMVVVRFFRIEDIAIELMLAIALSFAIDAFTAGIILYAGQWSPKNILSFLIGFCFGGAIAQLALVRPALIQPLTIRSVEEEEGKMIIDLAKAPSSRQKAEKTREIIELANALSNQNEEEDTDITLELAKMPSSNQQNEHAETTVNLKQKQDTQDTETTINLKQKQDIQDTETTINLKHRQNNENTEVQMALFLQFQQVLQEDSTEKTVSLDTSEVSSKEV